MQKTFYGREFALSINALGRFSVVNVQTGEVLLKNSMDPRFAFHQIFFLPPTPGEVDANCYAMLAALQNLSEAEVTLGAFKRQLRTDYSIELALSPSEEALLVQALEKQDVEPWTELIASLPPEVFESMGERAKQLHALEIALLN